MAVTGGTRYILAGFLRYGTDDGLTPQWIQGRKNSTDR
jgi:hypothetical protein